MAALDELILRHQNDFEAHMNPAGPASPQPGELAEGGHAASGSAVGLVVVLVVVVVWPFLPVQCGSVCRVGAAGPRPSRHQPARPSKRQHLVQAAGTFLPAKSQLVAPGSSVTAPVRLCCFGLVCWDRMVELQLLHTHSLLF